MPKLPNRPPKYSKSGKYAVVYLHGKRIYLGDYGSPESHAVYSRVVAESQVNPIFYIPKKKQGISVKELAAAFLDHAKETFDPASYGHCWGDESTVGFNGEVLPACNILP